MSDQHGIEHRPDGKGKPEGSAAACLPMTCEEWNAMPCQAREALTAAGISRCTDGDITTCLLQMCKTG